MPSGQLLAYVDALPAIAAGRSLQAVAEVGVGTGSLKTGARDQLVRDWQRGLRAQQRVVKPSVDELRVMASTAGVGVRTLKQKGTDARE